MTFKNVLYWLKNDFRYDVPEDYLSFLRKGDFSIKRLNCEKYIYAWFNNDVYEGTIDIEEWFDFGNLQAAYENGVDEGMADYYLPIFIDSSSSSVCIDCRKGESSFGNLIIVPSDVGYFDEDKQTNVWEYDFLAPSFSSFITNLISQKELTSDFRYINFIKGE